MMYIKYKPFVLANPMIEKQVSFDPSRNNFISFQIWFSSLFVK